MLHDPELVAETKAWFARAQTDIRAAAHDWTAEPPLVEDIVFHAQQAVEKCFKGFLAWHEEAAEAVAIAREVYEGLLTRLPEEVRP
jgi:hypothetical protein